MKKILVIIMALAMGMCFAACGDSGTSEEGQQETTAEVTVEPNAGTEGIEYALPDGWEKTDDSEGNFVGYTNPDSKFELGVTTFTQEAVDDINEAEKDEAQTVQEYYEENYLMTDKEMKDRNVDGDTVDVCGTEASVLKWKKGDEGYVDIGAAWVYDDICYNFWIYNENAFDDDGNILEDAEVLGDEDIAMYNSVIESIRPGDGTKY